MRHPSKRDEGRRIKIVGVAGTLDGGTILEGVYGHLDKRGAFDFKLDNGAALFMRNEWWVLGTAELPKHTDPQSEEANMNRMLHGS